VTITLPPKSLVVLIGPSGAGKSTLARRWFRLSEVVSSDNCRFLVSDDENDQSATDDAFDILHLIVARRLRAGRMTVVDATNVQVSARRPLLGLAREYDAVPVAIVFDFPEELYFARNTARSNRTIPEEAIRKQIAEMREGLDGLAAEGFRQVFVLKSTEEVTGAAVVVTTR
jgi:protein phosphatase